MGGVRRISRVVTLAAFAGALGACTPIGGRYFTPSVSIDVAKLSPAAAAAVADDMSYIMSSHIGPGEGTIVLKPDGSAFASALEEFLRRRGYAVNLSDDVQGGDRIPLAYVIDSFEGAIMARISTPTVELTRSYSTTETGALPASPVSVMRRRS